MESEHGVYDQDAARHFRPEGQRAQHRRHRCHEAVALARHRLQEDWSLRRVVQRPADLLDGSVDRRLDLELTSATYPTFDAMRAGTGTIQLRAAASIDPVSGPRRLTYQNNHRSDVGIYLVNALVPEAPDVVLGAPRRDERQQRFDLDYDVRTTPGGRNGAGRLWLFAGAVTVGGIAYLSRRWRRRGPVAQL